MGRQNGVARAFYRYAVRRGLAASFNDDRTLLSVEGPRCTANVRFDDRGRVADISGSLGG